MLSLFFKITTLKRYLYYILTIFLLFSCVKSQKKEINGAFAKETEESASDFSQIKEGGELIVTTLSGPDTYYDYQGVVLGKEYLLASNFATTEGLRLRVELAHDTIEMIHKLKSGEVDLIVFPLPEQWIEKEGLMAVGAKDKQRSTAWAAKTGALEMAVVAEKWWKEGAALQTVAEIALPLKGQGVKRHVYAPYLSRERGEISVYDPLFKEAAQQIGWDWRLIAAQCYQESAFDPKAISWAGAKGLMQLMPATAAQMGVKDVYEPRENVLGGVRYLQYLNQHFSDIPQGAERICFVLAAYNAGQGHIRDAMALTKKYGKSPTSWSDVSQYVLALEQVKYYRDPIVKHGYMIGRQTHGYVAAITKRYLSYGGSLTGVSPVAKLMPPTAPKASSKSKHQILTPDDPAFIGE